MEIKFIHFLIIIALHSAFFTLHSQSIRPIRDDVGFCWNATEMDEFIKFLSSETDISAAISRSKLIGGISVHDDYLYAGKIYYPLFKQIRTKEILIFGVTHGTVRKEMNDPRDMLILDEYDQWQGPYGKVEVSPLREMIKEKLSDEYYIISNKAHSIEHSIEALIPFLQFFNRGIKITPIMVTQMGFERMEEISKKLSGIILGYINQNKLEIGKDISFLISNDANHYGEDFNNSPYGVDEQAHTVATENDKRIINENLSGEVSNKKVMNLVAEILPDTTNSKIIPLWCGRYPVVFGLLTINNIIDELYSGSIQGELIKYSDTFTEKVLPFRNSSMGLTAPFSYKHWCGWFTLGLFVN
ncbi:MAG: AmmeMemoRadiSam system protein B [Bacteroidota bacterium]